MNRRKGNLFSSGKRRRKRRDYRNASIGPNMGGYDAHGNTHTARSVKKTKPAHAASSSQPGSRRAYRPGEIGNVRPRGESAETAADYSRRAQRRARSLRPPLDIPVRSIVTIVVIVVAAIAIAAGVASCVFQGSVNNRMALQDAAVAEALVAPENAEDPYYLLFAGSFDDAAQTAGEADVLMLVRADTASGKATIISIPSNLIWTLSDGSNGFIGRELAVGGDAGLVRTVADFAGVGIAHFATTDAAGFVKLVDALGGIDVELTEEVDDPEAGSIYLPAGTQTLTGEQALVACKAKNYLNGYETRAQVQMKVLAAIVRKAGAGEGLGARQSTLDAIAGTFQTDLSTQAVIDLLGRYGSAAAEDVYQARVPGYSGYEGGELQFSVAPNGWKTMMEKVNAGSDPNEKSEAVQSVDPSKYTLTVKNGAGVAGAASECAEALEAAGYKVKETGNTDQFAYNETLVVYKDEKNAAVAEAIADALGVGRPVEAGIYYEFSTDLQVIVGQDWKPRS
ncbi:MAG: LytR family transcriptional regulator [Coriobacteriaceae bacterium]|nr:LytR family transcriptional regulator [Coriobacteriaceae bacterium]